MRELAEAQHCVVGREQLRGLGMGRAAMARRVRSGRWEGLTTRVFRLTGSVRSAEQSAMAAVLDAGPAAVASYATAAALWDLPGFPPGQLEVSRPRCGANRPSTLAEVHHPRFLPSHHFTVRRLVPVTTLARTVFDLSGVLSEARTERALQAALRSGLRWETLAAHLDEMAARGRAGTALTRALMDRHAGKAVLGSGLEARFLRILEAAGLPEPRRQVDLGSARWAGRADFVYDDVGLVIEVNGNWSHTSPIDVVRDQQRSGRLVAAGFRVLPLPEDAILQRPEEVARLVRDARRSASRPSGRQSAAATDALWRPEAS